MAPPCQIGLNTNDYLPQLPSHLARLVFKAKTRMLDIKINYKRNIMFFHGLLGKFCQKIKDRAELLYGYTITRTSRKAGKDSSETFWAQPEPFRFDENATTEKFLKHSKSLLPPENTVINSLTELNRCRQKRGVDVKLHQSLT